MATMQALEWAEKKKTQMERAKQIKEERKVKMRQMGEDIAAQPNQFNGLRTL